MAEYIEREAVLKMQYWEGCGQIRYGVVDVADIENIPAADVVEVVHGKWEEADDGDGVVCSICREDFCNIYLEVDRFKYCPNCGAKMDGECNGD